MTMKINLSQKELEKTYSLLDTKEINMSVAELIFSTFEEKDFFAGSKNEEEFFHKLLEYWGIPEEADEDIALLDKCVRPVIKLLPSEFIKNNAYFKTIKPVSFKKGDYQLEYLTFNPYQPFSLNDIQVDEKDYFLERSPLSYFAEPVKYLALTYKGEVWMSITPNEINTMQPSVDKANGSVLVLGLGLGYYPFMVSSKNNVNDILIIEKDQTIIEIFNKYLLPHFPNKR